MTTAKYDAVVLGAGQGGGPLAGAFAAAGRRTALIERAHVGGTCINEGCTPTKTMVASARVAYLARRAADYGVNAGDVRVNMTSVRERKDAVVTSFRKGSERRLEAIAGLDLIRGDARFTGTHALTISQDDGEIAITADLIIIDVGGRPAPPRIPGLEGVPAIDSTAIMDLDVVPAHLIVLGGGYVGLEFAQMFRRFGSEVTVVQRGGKLLSREDDDIAGAILQILREDGIAVLLNAEAREAEPGDHDGVRLLVSMPDGERVLEGSHLLVAIGRQPNSDCLQLEMAGVKTDERGFIRVDERLATNVPGIYAIGDVNGGPAFTHISYDDFRVLRKNLIEGGNATTDGRLVPYTVFTDPQLGRVGLTETEARKKGLGIRVATLPMSDIARALEVDESRGFLKAVVDATTDQILGFAALGIEGGEIMAMAQIAMMGKLPYTALRDGIFSHPTLAEGFNNLFGEMDDG